MECNKIKLQGNMTVEKFMQRYATTNVRAYDSDHKNMGVKITPVNKAKYHVISAYYHDEFIAVYVNKPKKKGKKSK